jgi:DNA repair exonuclease SbcCD ATPase subunit
MAKKAKKEKAEKEISKGLEEKTYEELLEEKKSVEALLSSLEDDYREARISEETYQEFKEKNLKRLSEIEKLIKKKKGENEVYEVGERASPKVITEDVKSFIESAVSKKVSELTKGFLNEENVKKLAEKIFSEKIEKVTSSFTSELEKLKLLINTVKEGLGASNERLQMISEQLAELRTLSHQREAKVRELELKIEKFSDIVSDLELKALKKQFEKIDKNFGEHLMRIEKMEKLIEILKGNQERVGKILENIGSIENLLSLLKDIDAKVKGFRKKGESIERTAEKIEKLYIDLSKRLEEFSVYKEDQVKTKDLVKELMRSVDELNSRIAGYVKKEELESVKEMLEKRMESLKEETEELIPEPIKKLREEKAAIEKLLASLEEEYTSGTISEKDYEVSKEKNLEKLKEIEEKIRKAWEEIKGIKKVKVVEKPKEMKKEEALIAELDELFKRGLISKEAYERSKKILLSG